MTDVCEHVIYDYNNNQSRHDSHMTAVRMPAQQ
jgi:hypothetical protein